MKTCHRCHVSKPLDEFSPDASRRDGHASKCRSCGREVSQEYYARHRDERSAYFRRRYQEQKEAGRHPAGQLMNDVIRTKKGTTR